MLVHQALMIRIECTRPIIRARLYFYFTCYPPSLTLSTHFLVFLFPLSNSPQAFPFIYTGIYFYQADARDTPITQVHEGDTQAQSAERQRERKRVRMRFSGCKFALGKIVSHTRNVSDWPQALWKMLGLSVVSTSKFSVLFLIRNNTICRPYRIIFCLGYSNVHSTHTLSAKSEI